MHRFYSAHFSLSEQVISIDDPDELHHLAGVLRLKKDDELEVVNGAGLLARGVLSAVTKTRAEVRIMRLQSDPPGAGPRIVLACALPKKAKFESILEKATELGVDEVVPLLTERTETVIAERDAARKNGRFWKVVLNAGKQSRRLWFPKLHSVTSFPRAIELFAVPENRLFIPWLEGERVPVFQALQGVRRDRPAKMVFFIGPEGDFTPQEVELATEKGALPLDLGKTILKVDTAAACVVALARCVVDGES